MRIMLVGEYFEELGGTEIYMLSLIEKLSAMGHSVSCIYGRRTKRTETRMGLNRFHLPEIDNVYGNLSEAAIELTRKIVEGESPDVIFVQNVMNLKLIEYLNRLRPVVRFVHDHRVFCPKGDRLFFLGQNICRRKVGLFCIVDGYLRTKKWELINPLLTLKRVQLLRVAPVIHERIPLVVASDYMRQCLAENGFHKSSISVIPYFSSLEEDDSGEFGDFILAVGRFIPQKGFRGLIRACRKWPRGLSLKIVGGGGGGIQAWRFQSGKAHRERIELIGGKRHAEVGEYYRKCLAVAVPSLWEEPFGIVGLEAMQYGKAVVAFDVGGISDWLKDERNGFLVERGNYDIMSEKLELFFQNKDLAKEMGGNAKEEYARSFSWESHCGKLLKVFDKAVSAWGKS